MSLARAAAAVALLVLGAGCASAPHAAPAAGKSATLVSSGTAPDATASAIPASTTPGSSAPARPGGSASAPALPMGSSVFSRAFRDPKLTMADGSLYLSWELSAPTRFPPPMALARANPATGTIVAANEFSPGLVSVPLYAAGSLWVTDSGSAGELLLRLNPRTLMVTGELLVTGHDTQAAGLGGHIAFAGNWIWVDGSDRLVQVWPQSVAPARVIRLPHATSSDVGASPDGRTLIVSEADYRTGTVQRRNPATGALLASHPVLGVLAPAIGGVSGTEAWIAEPTGMMGYVERFSTAGMTPDRATQVEGTNGIRAQILNGVLWVTNPVGGTARDYCANPGTGRRLAALPFPDMSRDTLLAVGGDNLYYARSTHDGDGFGIAAVPIPAACLTGR